MARGRGRMALYEVIGKSKTLKELHAPQAQEPETKLPETPEPVAQEAKSTVRWPAKPRAVQFNAGRVEMSLPYPLATVLMLGIVMLILVAFRLGQSTLALSAGDGQTAAESTNGQPQADISLLETPAVRTSAPPRVARNTAVVSKGDNCIVVTQYHTDRDLKPVQEHFAGFGIETEIQKTGGRYFLVTKQLYENPLKSGSDGSVALKRIAEVGAKYKAPQGYESFRPNLFSDAYGKKVK